MSDKNFLPTCSASSLPIVNFYNIGMAGLSFQGAQEVNKAFALSELRLHEYDCRKAIDFAWNQRNNGNSPVASVPLTKCEPDLVALGEQFIQKNIIVKKRSTDPRYGRFWYFIRDTYANRHDLISDDVLWQRYCDHVFDNIEDATWDNEAALKRGFRRMLHKIPPLEKSGLDVVEPTEVMALDSKFDLKSCTLNSKIAHPRGIFNTASIPLNLLTECDETPAFDALLRDCFGSDVTMIHRAMEMIGALISPVKLKQSIFVFQGVGNGGKTRLARLIVTHILKRNGVFVGSDFSDLADDDLKRADNPYSLVFLRDSVDKVVAPKQRSFLKSYGDAGYDDAEPTYKVLICTNNAIYTGENGFVEKPLLNRVVVLSFPKEMDNDDPIVANFEELHLEKELPAIVLGCLRAYSAVLRNGGHFSGSCELNAVVEPNGEITQQEEPRSDIKATVKKVLDRCFEPCNEADSEMTTTKILQIVQSFDRSLQASPECVGRILKEHYGDRLVSRRMAAGMCYGLRFRESPNSDRG